MIILPFYQFLTGFGEKYSPDYFFLTPDRTPVPIGIPVHSLSLHTPTGTVYGIYRKNGRDVIGRTVLSFPLPEFSSMFSLSGCHLLHTAVSPDNQKAAFLTAEKETGRTQVRMIVREEFGWFPLPSVRFDAAPTGICFCSNDILLYSDPDRKLKAVRLKKPFKTAEISSQGYDPVAASDGRTFAFLKNGLIYYNDLSLEIKADSLFSFSKNGQEVFFSSENNLYGYNIETRQKRLIFGTGKPVVFATAL